MKLACPPLRRTISLGLIFVLLACTSSAYKDWPLHPDFDDTGAWDPTGDILDVANDTLGTKASCIDHGGKPFWQMQLGISDRSTAILLAPFYEDTSRSAWCSEAISYWHRRAGIPWSGGYECWWYPDWQLKNTTVLREWYQAAELINQLFGTHSGRGRWVSYTELDYENFVPGVTGPCPGAYQQLEEYDSTDEWSGNSHSQMVETMTVYKNRFGTVFRIDLQMIEGNSGKRVKNTTTYDDIYELTPPGSNWIGSKRKIRGWGIDLDSEGNPIYDSSKITVVMMADISITKDQVPSFFQEDETQAKKWVDYAQKLADQPVKVTSSSRNVWGLKDGLLGKGKENRWDLSLEDKEGSLQVDIDLQAAYPRPIRGVVLTFEKGLPGQVTLFSNQSSARAVRKLKVTGSEKPLESALQIPIFFEKAQQDVQHLHLKFSKGKGHAQVAITGFRIIADQGEEDSDENE